MVCLLFYEEFVFAKVGAIIWFNCGLDCEWVIASTITITITTAILIIIISIIGSRFFFIIAVVIDLFDIAVCTSTAVPAIYRMVAIVVIVIIAIVIILIVVVDVFGIWFWMFLLPLFLSEYVGGDIAMSRLIYLSKLFLKR